VIRDAASRVQCSILGFRGDLGGEIVGDMSTRASFEPDPVPATNGSVTPGPVGSVAGEVGSLPIGTLIADKYRVERVLGEGAMGIVLAARHIQLDELVAIKCIRAAVPWSSDVLARFAREAKACARLKSEHIAKVIDVGVSPAVGPFMVMEYLEGEDLAAVLRRRGPMPVRRAAEYVMQVCEALAVAHAASITHRDVKPENLFLTRHGDLEIIKVLDFGISKAPLQGRLFGGELAVKETQSLMGTPLYMSPEQIRSTREVDHRSDLWSLGVVLFELLTGNPAFAGETVTQVCARVLEAAPPRLGDYCETAPPGLPEIIDRCLMKDPARRFQSAAELANALLPFAPARARLHAERATSVLRVADPNAEEPLPSTRPDGRAARIRQSNLGTAPPTVVGEGEAPRSEGHRALLVVLCLGGLLGLGSAGLLALSRSGNGPGETKQSASIASSTATLLALASGELPVVEARPTMPAAATDTVAPQSAPLPTNPARAKANSKPALGKGRPSGAAPNPSLVKVAASEPAPLAADAKRSDSESDAVKPRVRLLDNGSPVRLLE